MFRKVAFTMYPVCRMAVCLDSEGNSILLHQLKPKEKQ
jgi:predicted enzyme related to lactoylglutathione lyase